MTVVVGVAPGHPSGAAVALAALLARSTGLPLVVAAVNSIAWPPRSPLSAVDGEYRRFVAEQAEAALDAARALVPADVDASYRVHGAPSARRGLLEVCEEVGAQRLVVGAKDEGPRDEITLGSVATGLLQSAHVPVAIAPRGYAAAAGSRLERVTAAYSGSETSAELVLGAAAIAAEAGEGIRIASFHTRPRAFVTARVGQAVEDQIVAEWEQRIREDIAELREGVERLARRPASVEVTVGAGSGWHEALRSIPWRDAEVLVVGSSSLGPLARVSLGSHAVKIVRHSPVPVVLVPRRATGEYAARGRA